MVYIFINRIYNCTSVNLVCKCFTSHLNKSRVNCSLFQGFSMLKKYRYSIFLLFIAFILTSCSQGTCLTNNLPQQMIHVFPNGATLYGQTNFTMSSGSTSTATYLLKGGGNGSTIVNLTTSAPITSNRSAEKCTICGNFSPESLVISSNVNESSSTLTIYISPNLTPGTYQLNLYATYINNGITYPRTQIGIITIVVDQNPQPTPTPTIINYYAFIAEKESGVLYCHIQESNATVENCQLESVPFATNRWQPTGLSFTKVQDSSFLYVVDSSSNNSIWKCVVNKDGSFNGCSVAYDYTSTRGIGDYYQISFAWVNGVQYSYMADSSTWINKCTVESDGTFSNCTQYGLAISTLGALQAYGVTVESINNSQYAYITDIHSIGDSCHLFKCSIESDGGIRDNCVAINGGISGWCPRTTTFNTSDNTYAYVAEIPQNGNYGGVYQCTINQQDGTFGTCTLTPSTSPNWYPYMSAFINNNSPSIYTISRAEDGNNNNSIYSCQIGTNGQINIGSCKIQQSNSAINNLSYAIVIQGFPNI